MNAAAWTFRTRRRQVVGGRANPYSHVRSPGPGTWGRLRHAISAEVDQIASLKAYRGQSAFRAPDIVSSALSERWTSSDVREELVCTDQSETEIAKAGLAGFGWRCPKAISVLSSTYRRTSEGDASQVAWR